MNSISAMAGTSQRTNRSLTVIRTEDRVEVDRSIGRHEVGQHRDAESAEPRIADRRDHAGRIETTRLEHESGDICCGAGRSGRDLRQIGVDERLGCHLHEISSMVPGRSTVQLSMTGQLSVRLRR